MRGESPLQRVVDEGGGGCSKGWTALCDGWCATGLRRRAAWESKEKAGCSAANRWSAARLVRFDGRGGGEALVRRRKNITEGSSLRGNAPDEVFFAPGRYLSLAFSP